MERCMLGITRRDSISNWWIQEETELKKNAEIIVEKK